MAEPAKATAAMEAAVVGVVVAAVLAVAVVGVAAAAAAAHRADVHHAVPRRTAIGTMRTTRTTGSSYRKVPLAVQGGSGGSSSSTGKVAVALHLLARSCQLRQARHWDVRPGWSADLDIADGAFAAAVATSCALIVLAVPTCNELQLTQRAQV